MRIAESRATISASAVLRLTQDCLSDEKTIGQTGPLTPKLDSDPTGTALGCVATGNIRVSEDVKGAGAIRRVGPRQLA